MDILHFLRTILGILPFVILCLANSKVNLNKADRSRQFLMPVISLVYCVLGIVFLDKINSLISKLFALLGQYIPFLQKISWQAIATFVLNAALVLGFIILKSAVLPTLSVIWKSRRISEVTSGWFYEREEDVDKWLLQPKSANLRGYIKGFYIASFIASVTVFVFSQNFPKSVLFQAAFYPVFGVLVLGEIVFFLSGMTKSEFVEDILGEDDEARSVANYGVLREILRDLFENRVLYDNTCDASDGISATFDELDEMVQSEDASLKLIGNYYAHLKKSGAEIDINYVKSSISLLNGKSTLFCNPFYSDLTYYITLPMIKQLISYKKCLIVLGRDSALNDVKNWIDTCLESFSNTDSLWQSQILDEHGITADVGFVKFSDIHNLKLQKANKEFLSKVGLILIIEPSRILASGQIGLGLLVNNCEYPGKNLVYCACDRNCDGLVDALSHTLKTSITEVTATVSGGGNNSQMFWNSDGGYMHHKIFPNISRYLGMGTEINAVAMKYQLDQTGWVGSEKFPVNDMKWIAGQYYKQICQYANLPEGQSTFDRSFHVYSNLWSAERKENSFLVVEDEFQNLFEIARLFASRAKSQGFVNVISENYFLRDYMLDNVSIFSSDPKAIPTIVPDFARTERNMVLKLIMMMAYDAVSEDRIAKELMLCGISFEDPYIKFKELITKHCSVSDASLSVRFKEDILNDSLNTIVVKYYEINETDELYEYAKQLKNAYYIAEDEEGESHFIGAKLYGHVLQAMLPGQFMTFDGKYYEVQTVTPLNGVVVRRAADHINGRHYYRQIRNIRLNNWTDGVEMGSKRTASDIQITRGYADICVETTGYLDMNSYGDLAHAKNVLLNGIPTRRYKNKSVLKIKLPETTNRIRYTICLLLNEIFRTTYPETYHYISALVPFSDELDSVNLAYATYQLTGDCDDECIYFVEDSDIDLGLIVSIDRNIKRYLEIVTDVLNWHAKKMLEKPASNGSESEPFTPDLDDEPQPKRKLLLRIIDRIREFLKKVFVKKKKEKPENAETAAEAADQATAVDPDENTATVEIESTAPNTNEEDRCATEPDQEPAAFIENKATEDKLDDDSAKEPLTLHGELTIPEEALSFPAEGDDIEDISGEDDEVIAVESATALTDYQKSCFIKFGFPKIDNILDIEGTIDYLHGLGLDKNPLQQVREMGSEDIPSDYDPHKYGAHLCDFCGVELLGGEYELLKDGRERCNRCSMTAIKKVEDFKALYKTVLRNMEAFYGIKLNVAVKVRTTNAKQIARHVGTKFVPTPGFDGRVLGFAKKDKTGYSLYIENGSPKLAAIATIAHELTHIWQYLNWNEGEIAKRYGKQNTLKIYEGMAKWSEIQYLMLMNEKPYAKRQEIMTRMRDDAYGRGFIMYAEKYPLTTRTSVTKTPFLENPPL